MWNLKKVLAFIEKLMHLVHNIYIHVIDNCVVMVHMGDHFETFSFPALCCEQHLWIVQVYHTSLNTQHYVDLRDFLSEIHSLRCLIDRYLPL